ncbi:MAG TPA: hypothetical protein VIX18_09300 [Nitrospirota bacterium]
MTQTYQIYKNSDRTRPIAVVTLTAPMLAGAETTMNLLDDSGVVVAQLILQPGYDRRTISQYR